MSTRLSQHSKGSVYILISLQIFLKNLQLTLKLIKTKVKPVNLLWKLTET